MSAKVLFVDDEPLILEGYERTLRNQFAIDIAHGGDEALTYLEQAGPYAVVVSDMRMPGMDGVQFLAKARSIAPETVRMMLTGANDLRTAMAAVNQGQIFRFLSQPCNGPDLTAALNAGVEQHRLITAERELLESTLTGAIKLLTEVLSLVNAVAFSRALRLTRHVQHMAHRLGLAHPWKFEAAAMLSQLGCVTLPSEILEAEYAGKRLSAADQQRFALHPSVAHDLLVNIPRLELVARMIARQGDAVTPGEEGAGEPDEVTIGARLLRVALDFDRLVMQGLSVTDALSDLRHHPTEYDINMVRALEDAHTERPSMAARTVPLRMLQAGMMLDEDIRTEGGLLLVAKGQEITPPLLLRLENFHRVGAISEEFRVLVPTGHVWSEDTASAPHGSMFG